MATADAVTQFRAGNFPVLVGQSEFAFMGRIHPLRTAPYLAYFSLLIDSLSFRQLDFWSLQNLALGLSLLGFSFSGYASLRRSTPVSPRWALGLTTLLLFSPAVLSVVYSMDLYMTVMALPFLPVVVGTATRIGNYDTRPRNWITLAAALAAVWTAHPPVALWTSLAAGILLIPAMVQLVAHHRWSTMRLVVLTVMLGGALGAFVFTSALSIKSYGDITNAEGITALLKETHEIFPASLRPPSATRSELGDFQLGYALWAGWALAGVGAFFAVAKTSARPRVWAALRLWGVATALLALLVPIPGLHDALWRSAPTLVVNLTNQWPMQRLYLVIAVLVVFAVALVWPNGRVGGRVPKAVGDVARIATVVALAWTLWQGLGFVRRGWESRRDLTATARTHADENLNPTLISYAIINAPGNFVNGVTDPEMELRLIDKATLQPMLTNWDTPTIESAVVSGTFRIPTSNTEAFPLAPLLTLEPDTRYRLDFDFLIPPVDGLLEFNGPTMQRQYPLPQSGGPEAFGMMPGNRRSLPLWSSSPTPQPVELRLVGAIPRGSFARFTLSPLAPAQFPLRLQSLMPLKVSVDAPAPALLETMRINTPGYAATVNGQPERLFNSADGRIWVPVPAGHSEVTLSYPGPPGLKLAFWTSFSSWFALAGLAGTFLFFPTVAGRLGACGNRLDRLMSESTRRIIRPLLRHGRLVLGAAVFITLAGFAWRWFSHHALGADEAGPIRVEFMLPTELYGRRLPVLTTGIPEAGTFIFVVTTDRAHVQIGVDVWGQPVQLTDPIPVDYYHSQELVISTGALYPADHPKLKGMDSARLAKLRGQITIDLNGERVVERQADAFASPPDMVMVGKNMIGNDRTDPKFVGDILDSERLPIEP